MAELKRSKHYYFKNSSFKGEADTTHFFIMENYNIGMHKQAFFEINIVIRGEGVHCIGEREVKARLGDVFIIPPEMEHGYVGGAGFVTQDIKHCYLMNCTASQTGCLGFDLGGVYYQGYGITATQTAGVLLHDGYYLTLGCLQADGEVLVQGCSTVLLQGVQAEKITERQGDFLLCIQTHDAAVSLQGAHSAYRREI